MRVVLVNPPKSQADREEIAPPLGLLRLARVAQESGATVYVEDYNLLWHLDERLRSAFYEEATQRLLALAADVYGFTSMAVDSHVALELARRLKRLRPEVRMIVGGVHFSSIASQVPAAFPWIDQVVTGEGVAAFAALLGDPSPPAGPVPRPLYEAVRLPGYFHVNPSHMVDLEAGRGCVYRCGFCYSPGHYHGVRDFATEDVIADLAVLPGLGVRHVWFVEDNFLNHPARAVRLCRAIEEAALGLTWSCYATFPQLTPPIVTSMRRAGCTAVFCGIDAVGSDAERSFEKAFLRGETMLERKTRWLTDAGITPTYAFMVAPPAHPAGKNFGVTVRAALEARILGAEALLNPLSLYSGTRASDQFPCTYAPDALQVHLMMDAPAVVAENPFAAQHPALFPFHARYVGEQEWHSFLSLTHCAATVLSTYPRTVALLARDRDVDPVLVARETLERFSDWSRLMGVERYQVEQDVSFFVLEALAAGTPAAAVLEEERAKSAQADARVGARPVY